MSEAGSAFAVFQLCHIEQPRVIPIADVPDEGTGGRELAAAEDVYRNTNVVKVLKEVLAKKGLPQAELKITKRD